MPRLLALLLLSSLLSACGEAELIEGGGEDTSAVAESFLIDESREWEMFDLVNRERSARGLGTLRMQTGTRQIAREWSVAMANQGFISHRQDLAAQVNARVTTSWRRLGENVGVGYDIAGLHQAFMNSPAHRDNVLGDYNYVGIGVEVRGDKLWITLNFMRCDLSLPTASPTATPTASRPAPPKLREGRFYVKHTVSGGYADLTLSYGAPGDIPVFGDWNGDGVATPGIVRNGVWHLRNSLSSGVADVSFGYGDASDYPIVGDWNGDGIDTPGVVRGNTFHLRNSNSGGVADVSFNYGLASDLPLVGDWDGNGTDTIGVKRGGSWYLRNSNTGGVADVSFSYGNSSDVGIPGDWNGDGRVTAGVFRSGTWYLRDSPGGGVGERTVSYGQAGDIPLAGDTNKDRISTPVIAR